MIKLFKYKKDTIVTISPLWKYIHTVIHTKAKQSAVYLNGKTAIISRRNLSWLLVSFCICWGSSSMFIISRALQHKGGKIPMSVIAVLQPINNKPIIKLDAATTQALTRITTFQHYIDSLHRYDLSKYQELVRTRPGLLDSIAFIEHYYTTLKK